MEYLICIIIKSGIYSILSLSLNLVVGFSGIVSLCQIAFFSVGAYSSSLLTMKLGIDPWVGLLIGGAFTSLFGIVVAFLSIKLREDYLALATYSFGMIIYFVIKNWSALTRGPQGLSDIPSLSLFGLELSNVWLTLLIIIIFVIITYVAIKRITNSPFGLAYFSSESVILPCQISS